MNTKSVDASRTTMSSLCLPSMANPAGNVHGGEIMKLMDNTGAVAAMRHSRKNVVTLRVDEMIFHCPIFVGHLVTANAWLIDTGTTSMKVRVEVWIEDLTKDNATKLAQSATFIFVALDEDGKPTPVPKLSE